ncbi:hypothetical protein [Micromonospora thermarum]|uniref:Uncharacterized protein n=1 Tax=Micromonospora thermarum TaxID=2720024 RepID=A0ABX0ZBC4_9ACTN|nr:hypothetical protein [Micromonospora thermarum]NJP34798.1 hypothetical protein [Micromonospora thermarum]
MRDFSNLQWPEAPFGAEQRPFGRRWDMLAAFAIDWAEQASGLREVPVAAATVYLRVRRHGSAYDISGDTLQIGFRATVLDHLAEAPNLLALTDRALTRARRHAVILAGHALGQDLTRMMLLSTTPLRGAAGVAEAWANRSAKGRGLALMIDTSVEASQTGAALDMPTAPLPAPMPDEPASAATAARTVLARALAIGLTAAVQAGRYRWEGTFPVADAIDRAAWDVLDPANTVTTPPDTTRRAPTPVET